MTGVALSANEFIEAELGERNRAVAKALGADVLNFKGSLFLRIDDAFRAVVEEMDRTSDHDKLIVMVTTDGGYIEIVHRIVEVLRHHYNLVEFVIPNYAYSAGTVLVMSGDAIHMNYYSRLGPIDPQVQIDDRRQAPALGYLKQWESFVEKANDGTLTTAELQVMIYGFNQAELYMYEQARDYSIGLLKEWLTKYKFKNWDKTQTSGTTVTQEMKTKRADEIAQRLSNPSEWHSHGYGISMDVLINDLNLLIDDFDSDTEVGGRIKEYDSLLSDYTIKLGLEAIIHTDGILLPIS